ncbi:hypothetical protein PS655_02308 [Pseudomonas fluorescens]|uniref:Uncharacterized protein n=1 Tax=Pseudomonas fluorescens TaxID=294 RepID=A0A5E6SJH0_PSEFL|nr:hypothetical protein PS655_02308 [Pseudomonas fluorescens]
MVVNLNSISQLLAIDAGAGVLKWMELICWLLSFTVKNFSREELFIGDC